MSYLEQHYQKIINANDNDFRQKALKDFVIQFVPENKSVLDVGCGYGFLASCLAKKGNKVIAIEPSKKLYRIAKKRVGKLKDSLTIYNYTDKNLYKINKQFDIVIILDVLEHIKNDRHAIINICSLLKNKGKIIVVVPAHKHLYGKRDKSMKHLRRYSLSQIKNLVRKCDCKIDKAGYWNMIGYFVYFISEKILHKQIDERVRYNRSRKSSKFNNFIYKILSLENNIPRPIGLSAFVVATKNENK